MPLDQQPAATIVGKVWFAVAKFAWEGRDLHFSTLLGMPRL